VVVGGAKVADKIGVLRSLIPKSDIVIVGGRMAFTFLAAMGVSVGMTQIESNRLEDARSIIELSKKHGVKLFLPVDANVSESLDKPLNMMITEFSTSCCTDNAPCVSSGHYGIDIGPRTEVIFADALSQAKTIFLNGPMVRVANLSAFCASCVVLKVLILASGEV
jgi:phosphoglycerate kinase